MAFIKAKTGSAGGVDQLKIPCGRCWTITVKNGNEENNPNLKNTKVQISVNGGKPYDVPTDSDGLIWLEFDPEDDLAKVKVSINDSDKGLRGIAGTAQPAKKSDNKYYQSNAILLGTWKLLVSVLDATQKADGKPIQPELKLKKVQLDIKGAGITKKDAPRTQDDGASYSKDDMKGATEYTISVPDIFGAILKECAAKMRLNDQEEKDISTDTLTLQNVTVSRTKDNLVKVSVERGSPKVEIRFLLKFPKVFIVGEGPEFPYAIGLAKKYAKGESESSRKLRRRAVRNAPDTKLSEERKWVIVSQFDIHSKPAGNDLPGNLLVYRDTVLKDDSNKQGRFDVRDQQCWKRLVKIYGPFDAIIFNNPHPGYGMHRCDVFGLRKDHRGLPGKYISVHSIGWEKTLSEDEINLFRGYGNMSRNRYGRLVAGDNPGYNMNRADNQRYFLYNDIRCFKFGTNSLNTFSDDGTVERVSIVKAFTPLEEEERVPFEDRCTHYEESQNATGLWGSILKCYRLNGAEALKSGGSLYLHGSESFSRITREGNLMEGFIQIGTWSDASNKDASIYYANYKTNFTSTSFHPSWFAKILFDPGEPNLKKANCFRLTKKT